MRRSSFELARSHPAIGDPIGWKAFGSYSSFHYKVLNVDEERHAIDMLFRFEPNGFCFHHRHRTLVSSIVLEGV
jgi:hypothetical protein